MKKTIGMILLLALLGGILSGCGDDKDADVSTLFVDKNGQIVEVSVGDFQKDNYDAEEFEQYVKSTVEAYGGEGTVEFSSVSVDEGTAKLKMEYSDSDTYAAFTGQELFAGTVVSAVAKGYDFNEEFTMVNEGTATDVASRDDVLGNDEYRVVILQMAEDVKVEGTIVYVSAGVTVKNEDTATVKSSEHPGEVALRYIIYQ